MLLSRSLRGAAGKGWDIKVKDFIPESLAGAKGREEMCLTVFADGGEFVLLCFVFKPRMSPVPSIALGAWSWHCFESLTHDGLCKGGHVFLELSVLVCQACAWKAMRKGKGFPGRNAVSGCAKPVVGNSVLSCFW